MTPQSPLSAGVAAEQRALRFLKSQGLELLRRNYRCRFGEIDLIMADGECLVFIEVRYRAHNRFACAGQTIDYRKRQKLIRTAAMFLSRGRYTNRPTRFDVVAIDHNHDDGVSLQWMQDAFRPEGSQL